ncbi:3' terminal RNA ribose 2'-O-methyltransferase Hen1 [Haloactinomyces albus]|uniref:Small RNA 2'-O-methyltransferase n=1 Tax=Haloactinomyces albus TaxID=1352928 RepID=A0AAE3ZFQ9_9ACTN|nr:3' terminal RNA ribose 2'-O-methyltransferase Hen1 [Haloactinomyces albus]MDR7302719.1 3' terminal RNA ribose 2'-O-methyltransferase Hen1 [Haloactinomyces albus]
MLLTLSTTLNSHPATDLGFLLHKHPERLQSFEVMAGTAHVFYPRADAEECTAALLLEINPVDLARHARRSGDRSLGTYVNDRPYVASSLLAVALGKVFRTALNGRCDARPELVRQAIPLRLQLPAVPDGGAPELLERLFAPLGWHVETRPLADPEWGRVGYVELTLRGELPLAEALNQLYVLLPVLDDTKHYWVAEEEVDKLLRAGGDWLTSHPDRELISRRYLAHARTLVTSALTRLADPDSEPEPHQESGRPLAAQRRSAVLERLRATGARSVVDLGCGDGRLLRDLLDDAAFTKIVGVDVSTGALAAAERKLGLERLPERQRQRLRLRQSALTYTDSALSGHDAVVLMEVIEHLDPARLPAMEHAVFGHARPATVLVTTPNTEYNVRYPNLAVGAYRHPDHRFEWDRAQFAAWAGRAAERFGYAPELDGVGEHDAELGHPTQLAVFTRTEPGRTEPVRGRSNSTEPSRSDANSEDARA